MPGEECGYSRSPRSQYVAADWLEQPARGVFRGPRGALSREQVRVIWLQLQSLMRFPATVGGRSALEQQGSAHYLSYAAQEIRLYGDRHLLGWTQKLPLETRFAFRSRMRLFSELTQPLPVPALSGPQPVEAETSLLVRALP